MAFFNPRRQPEPEPAPREEKIQPTQVSIPQQPIGFQTILSTETVLEGRLSSKGNVRIDGTFTGTLDISGNVLVGETAKITADIDARNISIAGAIRGNVTGNKVQILRTGRVWGDIKAKALATEEGAFIDGKITMTSHAAMTPAEPVMVEVEESTSDAPTALADAPIVDNTQADATQPPSHPNDEQVSDPEA